ncbi:MAG: VWA domain-containing protein [Candidatus Yonathbacteria bacterium]|nr:VWA domain-containing protein [Candidatus Yonathbacteria bacterium]
MEWAQKRKIMYALGFAGIAVLLAAYPVYQVTHPAPTCFDQKQNGTETGVDCGGSCVSVCTAEVKAPRVVWGKAFPLEGDRYDLGAYVENANVGAGVKNARYTFKVFDSAGNILIEKKGETELAPASAVILFATGIALSGNPDRVDVAFDASDLTHWNKASTASSVVTSKNQSLRNTDTKPRLNAIMVNTDLVDDVANLVLSAIIYDARRHPVAVSSTYVNSIPRASEQPVFFTWPHRFTKNPRGGMCATPVDTMLVFDRSGSMDVGRKNPPEPLTTAKNAAIAYVDSANTVDKVGLVSFANTASSPIDHELSVDHKAVINALSAIAISKDELQNTNFGDAIKSAFAELQSARHVSTAKRVIVALTDGDANRPLDPVTKKDGGYAKEYAANAANDARKEGIGLYAIGLGTNIDEAFLRDRIGGDPAHYFSAPTAESLQAVYKTISETVCPPENFITEIVVTPRAIFSE